MTTHLSLHSKVMAVEYKIIQTFVPRLSFLDFALRYPVFCYTLSLWFLFFIISRYFSLTAAYIATAGLALEPTTIYRSAGGFVDRDPFCLLLALGAYGGYLSLCREKSFRSRLYATFLCGAFSTFLGLAWEGGGLFTVLFAMTLFWLGCTGSLTFEVLLLHLLWCLVAIPPLYLSHIYFGISRPYVLLTVFPTPIVCIIGGVAYLQSRKRRSLTEISSLEAVPGKCFISSALLIGLICLAGLWVFFPPGTTNAFADNAMSTLGSSRLMRSVGELQPVTIEDWLTYYSYRLVFIFIGLFFSATTLGRGRIKGGAGAGAAAVALSILSVSSNDLAALIAPSHNYAISGVIRLAALLGWCVAAVFFRRRTNFTEADTGQEISTFFLITWWFLLLTVSGGAQRHLFFLMVPAWILIGFGSVIGFFDFRFNSDRRSRETASGIFLSVVLAVNCSLFWIGYGPFRIFLHLVVPKSLEATALSGISAFTLWFIVKSNAQSLNRRYGYASYYFSLSSPILLFAALLVLYLPSTVDSLEGSISLTSNWAWLIKPLQRLDRLLPRHAVVLAQWEDGSYINEYAHRATFIDEDHFKPLRIAEVAREAQCAQDPSQARSYLVRHGITHWLLTDYDMQLLPEIAWVGADPKPAPAIELFPFEEKQIGSSTLSHEINLLPKLSSEADLILPDSTINQVRGTAPRRIRDMKTLQEIGRPLSPVLPILLRLKFIPNPVGDSSPRSRLASVRLLISIGSRYQWLTPRKVVFSGRTHYNSGSIPRGAVIINEDPSSGRLEGIYLSEEASRLLSIRLFLLGETLPGFHEIPLDPDTGAAGRLKIWEIEKPVSVQVRRIH